MKHVLFLSLTLILATNYMHTAEQLARSSADDTAGHLVPSITQADAEEWEPFDQHTMDRVLRIQQEMENMTNQQTNEATIAREEISALKESGALGTPEGLRQAEALVDGLSDNPLQKHFQVLIQGHRDLFEDYPPQLTQVAQSEQPAEHWQPFQRTDDDDLLAK